MKGSPLDEFRLMWVFRAPLPDPASRAMTPSRKGVLNSPSVIRMATFSVSEGAYSPGLPAPSNREAKLGDSMYQAHPMPIWPAVEPLLRNWSILAFRMVALAVSGVMAALGQALSEPR